ncbi:hypothetical protein Gbth_045_017 [Gluconobacter thailandicus F149-1 = NBRC 100600]|uniref:Transposase n=1 Tax=Gluconobacter thailandicus NBRC 3257 TaxID=1381097 RepID=A0ABQ0IUP8_GLUTH|nr:hypothetical protein B932_1515 [Gluconobacter oxydans H24]KXV53761.1 hypothetical protein AD946_06290 [Gluconobacter thailandicus]GAC86383.1 hypothetical protein NBRC3255_0044 [Gluconobacter thailandicus NBRC 3255]GAD25944.1 hypothetical protein NBRC3257_0943 [Gluconobacter thailandicus NBRC 3257]GAN91424.1 hypothetical protein Gbfr_037_019 [Gluconobacter frateurii M-2]GAN94142.1 hypothetical protein Gbth_045_017 [Gluconobacter thailandicus F149-1 = NBRC 100600]
MGHCAGLSRDGTDLQQSLSPLAGHPKVKTHSIHGRWGNVNNFFADELIKNMTEAESISRTK